MSRKYLKVIPLGGVDEVGRNSFLYVYGDEAIMVDAGRKILREDDPLSEDPSMCLPNFEPLRSGRVKLLGIFITHGHLDHVGALPGANYYAPRARIFASSRTVRFYAMHFDRNHGVAERLKLREKTEYFNPGDLITIGPFVVRPYAVNHSIPGACLLSIEANGTWVVHTGDMKMVGMLPVKPVETISWQSLQSMPKRPDLLVVDTVNARLEGFTPSEHYAVEGVKKILGEAGARVIVAQFATNLARMEALFDAARAAGRSVGFCGRAIRMAGELIGCGDSRSLPYDGEMVFASGSQGEPWSALWRAAMDDPDDTGPHLRVRARDTVVFSSRAIPPVKDDVARTVARLQETGARIILHEGESKKMELATPAEERFVHVSGHCHAEDLRMVANVVEPKRILAHHADPETLDAARDIFRGTGYADVLTPQIMEEIKI